MRLGLELKGVVASFAGFRLGGRNDGFRIRDGGNNRNNGLLRETAIIQAGCHQKMAF